MFLIWFKNKNIYSLKKEKLVFSEEMVIGRTPIIFSYKWANCDKIYKMPLTQSIINEDPINNNNNKWRYNIYIYIYVYLYLYIYLFILRIKVSWKMDYYELSSYNNNLITIKLEINNFTWSNWDGVFGYCFIILLKLRLDNLLAKTLFWSQHFRIIVNLFFTFW